MRARHTCRWTLAAALAAAVTGCALNPPPTSGELQKDALPHTTLPAAWKAGAGARVPVADGWLGTFNDPALSALVAEAGAPIPKQLAIRVEETIGELLEAVEN